MNKQESLNWQDANRDYLAAALACVKCALQQAASQAAGMPLAPGALDAAATRLAEAEQRLPMPAALQQLCRIFDLSDFERDLLLLCAAPDLDAECSALYAGLQGGAERTLPTFGLALAVLPGAHWSAILPLAPLRHWRLIEVATGETLTRAPLRIDERILHFLSGAHAPDERLGPLLRRLRPPADLAPSHLHLVERIGALLLKSRDDIPVVCLSGSDRICMQGVAAQVCAQLELDLQVLRVEDIPAAATERRALARLWERESILSGSALLIDLDEGPPSTLLQALLDDLSGVLFITSRLPGAFAGVRPLLHFTVDKPATDEQAAIWTQQLAGHQIALNGFVPALVSQFNLRSSAIDAACAEALARLLPGDDTQAVQRRLWDACRIQARPRLDDVAQRVLSDAGWEDLVLPAAQMETLSEIVAHVRQRHTVYERWGFAARSPRGLGTGVVFAGPSGTGKTLAAEVMANQLHLDLYHIDLSAVVSKYIGETEKNLRRIFDAAENGGAILLFDEADALFGKRSEVKDSHDRYANIEVSFLLQQMEAYRGLAILTTNLLNAFDSAFLRRIRFIVHFPAPALAQRTLIWERIFPAATPTRDLDVRKLARLNITGGNIRNIALNAAFLAADAGEAVGMAHLLRAASVEYAKLEKPLTEAEVRDWVAHAS